MEVVDTRSDWVPLKPRLPMEVVDTRSDWAVLKPVGRKVARVAVHRSSRRLRAVYTRSNRPGSWLMASIPMQKRVVVLLHPNLDRSLRPLTWPIAEGGRDLGVSLAVPVMRLVVPGTRPRHRDTRWVQVTLVPHETYQAPRCAQQIQIHLQLNGTRNHPSGGPRPASNA